MVEEINKADAPHAVLKVSHPHESNYLARSIYLSLDGQQFSFLKPGYSVSMDIETGHHSLRADNTFHKKAVEFDARPGETVRYKIWNRHGFGSWMIQVFGAGPAHLELERVTDNPQENISSRPPDS